jgi:nucleotide-binding universal stress UspA family protein
MAARAPAGRIRRMTNPIIVGVDPLREDLAPLHLATAIARATSAPLVVVAAFQHDAVGNAVAGGEIERDLRAHAAARLTALPDDIDAQHLVIGGRSAAHVLHETAAERDAGLLVVGSTRRGPLGRLAPGSTAERLLAGASCPVAIAPSDLAADWSPRRIGVGFVDLDEGHEALRAAGALALASGAELMAVTAVEPTGWAPSVVVAPYAIDTADSETWLAAAGAALDRALATLPEGLRSSARAVRAFPPEALGALSGEVDLLVCGSRGYGPLRAVLLGGVTHRLMREARCPVIIVPRGTEQPLEQLAAEEAATTG